MEFQLYCKTVMDVAYIPLKDVLAGWVKLCQYIEGLNTPAKDLLSEYLTLFLEHFEETYVQRFGRNAVVKPPLYPSHF